MNFDLEKFSYRLTVLLDEHNMSQTQLAIALEQIIEKNLKPSNSTK